VKARPWPTTLFVGLLLIVVVFLGYRFFGPQGTPTFDPSPAGANPVEESNP